METVPSEDQNKNQQRAERSKNREWCKIAEFGNTEEVDEYIKREGIWSKCSAKKTLEGEEVEYRCKRGSYRVGECPTRMFCIFHATSEVVSVYATNSEHLHQELNTRGLDDEMKVVVKELYANGVEEPNALLSNIRKKRISRATKNETYKFSKKTQSGKKWSVDNFRI